MHFTLHLTNNCNMACKYCYVENTSIINMSLETAKKAVDLAAIECKDSIGMIFFGGEPLLRKELIFEIVEYCKWKERNSDSLFHYKVTTNGLLLDEEFMTFSEKYNVFIALSHDGTEKAHNLHRVDQNGNGTFSALDCKIDMLLGTRPYAPVLLTLNPDTASYYAESVKYLYSRGFKYLICSLNYAANWTKEDMEQLKEQYKQLADFYYKLTLAEEKFYLSPFEVKISSHINNETYCRERCELGKKQISVAPDGYLFPCVQFVGDSKWSIGHLDHGIDILKRQQIYEANEEEKNSCRECAVKSRCNHYCGCLNRQATGSIHEVSPALCAHERILLPIADKLAGKLFKKRNPLFIQKHYNEMFPILSLIEDATNKTSVMSNCSKK